MPLSQCLEHVCAPECEWISHSNLISLYALMYKAEVGDVALALIQLQIASKEAAAYDRKKPGLEAPQEAVDHIKQIVEQIQSFQEKLQFDHALRILLYSFVSSLNKGIADLRSNALQVQLDGIILSLIGNLKTRLFLFVPSDRASFHQNWALFGDAPYIFTEAAAEMLDAGNSYAANLPNACVFHSTRVSEHGLRAIARKLKIKLRDRKSKLPLEYADWERVITEIENAIDLAHRKPKGPKRNTELLFYAEAVGHCRHIKDLFRNEISHTRKRYTLPEAYAAMSRVADFMKLLTGNLYSEKEFKRRVLALAAKTLNQPALAHLGGVKINQP